MKADPDCLASEAVDGNGRFRTTRWTLVQAINGDDPQVRQHAMDALAARCWPAIYAYLRRHGRRPDQAEELAQAFFADVVFQRRLFENADPLKGRLRSLILRALDRYLIDCLRRDGVRGHSRTFHAPDIDRMEAQMAGVTSSDPNEAFNRTWALSTLNEAIRQCRAHYMGSGLARHWALFESRELQPLSSGTSAVPLAQAAAEFGFASPAQAAAAVQTVKRHLKQILEHIVAEGCGEAVDPREELQSLVAILGAQR